MVMICVKNRVCLLLFSFVSRKEDKRVQVAAIKFNKLELDVAFSQEVYKFNFPST